jgi:hypothetical protein
MSSSRDNERVASSCRVGTCSAATVELIASHVASSTGGGRVLLLLQLDAARSSSVFKFPVWDYDGGEDGGDDDGNGARSQRFVAVYELPPAAVLTHRVAHAKALLEAQGALSFRTSGASDETGTDSAPGHIAPASLQCVRASCRRAWRVSLLVGVSRLDLAVFRAVLHVRACE